MDIRKHSLEFIYLVNIPMYTLLSFSVQLEECNNKSKETYEHRDTGEDGLQETVFLLGGGERGGLVR